MVQENTEDKSLELEMNRQRLESKNEESQNETSKQSPQEEQKSTLTEKRRMIFLALLDAAMRYREGYFREEIEGYVVHVESLRGQQLELTKSKLTKGQVLNERIFNRRFDEKAKSMIVNFKNKQEEFNRIAYKKIEEVVENMSPDFKYRFDNYTTGFGILMEEFMAAKNTTELLTICKLYNQGLMESTFAEIRKKRENEKENIIIDSSDKPDAIEPVIVQEGESSSATTNNPIDQSGQH